MLLGTGRELFVCKERREGISRGAKKVAAEAWKASSWVGDRELGDDAGDRERKVNAALWEDMDGYAEWIAGG